MGPAGTPGGAEVSGATSSLPSSSAAAQPCPSPARPWRRAPRLSAHPALRAGAASVLPLNAGAAPQVLQGCRLRLQTPLRSPSRETAWRPQVSTEDAVTPRRRPPHFRASQSGSFPATARLAPPPVPTRYTDTSHALLIIYLIS